MKFSLICLLAFAGIFAALASPNPAKKAELSERDKFAPAKVLDFDLYKSLFRKTYNSVVEEAVRQKVFLGRAFQALLSAVGYKFRKQDSYLAVNQMSDWTPEELDAMVNREMSFGADSHEELTGADLADIEFEFAQIEARKNEPGYAQIAAELHNLQGESRSKREADTRRLSMDDLMKAEDIEVSEKLVDFVPSNNPDFEEPELSSQGVSEQIPVNFMDIFSQKVENILPGAFILGSSIQSLVQKFQDPSIYLGGDESDLPDEVFIDHRQSGCLSPVKNQGRCGSCYAFSTMSLYEFIYCHQFDKLVELSEQFVVDCGQRVEGLSGCKGGFEMQVAKFVNDFGLHIGTLYPYKQKVEECPYDQSTPGKNMAHLKVDEPGFKWVSQGQFAEILKVTPVLVALKMTRNFHFYGGGVDDLAGCGTGEHSKGGHAMLVVGHGREDGKGYWLIRNSYSSRWGLQGYYKLNKRSDCLMYARHGMVSKAKFRAPYQRKIVWADSKH